MQQKTPKILIAEDDFVVAKNLTITLEEKGYEVMAVKETGEELLNSLKAGEKPDLLIMDINLAGLIDGISTVNLVKESDQIPVLYLTSDRDRATLDRAKLTQPAGYLIKPFDEDELVSAIELALYKKQIQKNSMGFSIQSDAMMHDSYLFIKAKNRLEKVRYDEILYVEANDIYATLTTRNQNYILSYPLKTLEAKFPSDRLMRVHRSFIVNLDHIEAIEDNFILIREKNIPIGKTHRVELMRRLSIL